MERFKLTAKGVREAARRAYLDGLLSAQGPTPECRYRDAHGRPCAVGAAIPDNVLAGWSARQMGEAAAALFSLLDISASDEAAISDIQATHDNWCLTLSEGRRAEAVAYEVKFRTLIGLPAFVEAIESVRPDAYREGR